MMMIMVIDWNLVVTPIFSYYRYGDKVPSSDRSKAFAVVWVLMGLVIFGIFSGAICTAFTTVIYQSSTRLYGSEVSIVSSW